MTVDGVVLLHGYAVKCGVAPSKTIKNPKVLSPILVDPWSKKMRSPRSLARSPLTRDLSGLGSVELQMGMSSPHAGKDHELFQEGPHKMSAL